MRWILFFLICLSVTSGCRRLDVQRRYVGRAQLASTFVKSPDPLQKTPPTGEQLWVFWNLPSTDLDERLILTVRVIFQNLEEDIVSHPIHKRFGRFLYSVTGDEYVKNRGILTYRAEIKGEDGRVLHDYKTTMWFQPIKGVR